MKKFWNFVKNEDTSETELYFEGPISDETWLGDEITPALFRDELSKVSGDLTVWLNSPGGDCISASQIYTMLRNHKSKVSVKIDGIAASAASVVAMAGDETLISPTGYLMIHNPMTYASGNKAEMEKAIALLDEIKEGMWNACEPFSNPTIKRMLTVAHGTFCLLDLGDAAIRGFMTGGGTFNVSEFFLRLNIVGVGRFTISLYGEAKRAMNIRTTESNAQFARKEMTIVNNYLDGLSELSKIYDDSHLVDFIDDLKHSNVYIQAFEKSAHLAEQRKVPEEKILRTKPDIDSYFRGNKS